MKRILLWKAADVPLDVAAVVMAAFEVDGAFLAGMAALVTAISTSLLGFLAQRRGNKAYKANEQADAWKQLADARARELELLRQLAEAEAEAAAEGGAPDEQ